MTTVDQVFYVSSVAYNNVAQYSVGASYAAGALVRQLTAPATNSERVFICVVAGVAGAEPAWNTARGTISTSTVSFQECTGTAAFNGDSTDTYTWSQYHAIQTITALGQVIQRNNGASIWICTAAGTIGGSEPSWSSNAVGTTQVDGTVTWTCVGQFANFPALACPHARIQNAFATGWYASGNTIWVADNHSETQNTAITWGGNASTFTFGYCLSYDHNTAALPPSSVRSGATVSTTTNNVDLTVGTGSCYFKGINFIGGSGVTVGSNQIRLSPPGGEGLVFEDCTFWLANTNSSFLAVGAAASPGTDITWINCQVKFTAAASALAPATVIWRWSNPNGQQVLVAGSTVPTNFISFGLTTVSNTSIVQFEGLDFSQLTTRLNNYSNGDPNGQWILKDCKIPSSVSITQPTSPNHTTQLFNNNSSTTRYQYTGIETTEYNITRVGGATDPAGTQQSRLYNITANNNATTVWVYPYRGEPFLTWNNTLGKPVVVSVHGTWQTGRAPYNDEVWMDVEYYADPASSIVTIVTTTKANLLAAPTLYARSGAAWNGGGSGNSWTPFVMQVHLDGSSFPVPQQKGQILVRPKAAANGALIYLDPKIVLTNS